MGVGFGLLSRNRTRRNQLELYETPVGTPSALGCRMRWISFTLLTLALGGGCADQGGSYADYEDDGFSGGASDAGASICFSSNECPTGYTCNEFGACVPAMEPEGDGGTELPEEVESQLAPPIHSERFVYVAMTELDALARIDGQSLEVESIPVGDQPEVLAAMPGSDGVVVLDRNNGTATVVRPQAGDDDSRVLPTLPNMNRISIDPTGTYALAWFDLRAESLEVGGLGNVGNIGSFQDVTLIRLTQNMEHSVDLTVGFRPRSVQFDALGQRAFVVTDDGISVLDMAAVIAGGPSIVAPIPITDEVDVDPTLFDVNVAATGQLATIRKAGSSEMAVVQLTGEESGRIARFDLGAPSTDVDLSADGNTAYVVLRTSAELALIDLSAGLPDSSDITTIALQAAEVGSLVLSPDENEAILFTNATRSERLLHIDLQAAGRPQRLLRLQKSVRELGFSPTGDSVLVTHSKDPGSPTQSGLSFEEFIDRSFGYTVVDVATGFGKLQVTPANPGPFQFSLNTPRAYVLLDGGDAFGATADTHIIELDTGVVRVQTMNSPPESIGILPAAGKAFVNQRHPLGRVSFIDVVNDGMRTVTGFDLNSRIVD